MNLPNAVAYDEYFYRAQAAATGPSARNVLRLFLEKYRPASMADIGCGSGVWVDALVKFGVQRVAAVDGPWARNNPMIPEGTFVEADLSREFPQIKDGFDAAMSLEVAEHLPRERSEAFVEFLTSLAPVVLFSAAIPGQGGANHVNERWQSEWAEMFWKRGYRPNLELRRQLWDNAEVDWWYRQNIVVYEKSAQAQRDFQRADLDVVHPGYAGKYLKIIGMVNVIAGLIPRRVKGWISRLLIVKG